MTGVLDGYTRRLTEIFHRAPNKHEAHFRSREVLKEMAASGSALTAILERHLDRPENLNTRHYPVIGVDVELNADYGLVANCWIPLPGRRTDVTTKAIHHHGEMLLTTVTAFGPGYEHLTFSRPELVNPDGELFTMRALARETHSQGHAAFVDAYIAHVPLYPPALTITLALWSHRHRTSWRDRLKRLPLWKGNEESLRRILAGCGLSRALDLKVVEYFDFYPAGNWFRGMRERSEFERGPNADYLVSLFHVLQKTGNQELAARIESRLGSARIDNRDTVEHLLCSLEEGWEIEARLSEGHFDQPFANFTHNDIERALNSVGSGPRAPAVP